MESVSFAPTSLPERRAQELERSVQRDHDAVDHDRANDGA
jgi:hypothetical protein